LLLIKGSGAKRLEAAEDSTGENRIFAVAEYFDKMFPGRLTPTVSRYGVTSFHS
jgi:hypothetical protein